MTMIVFLLVVAFVFVVIGQYKQAEIIISPIKGIMFGFLYHKDEYEDVNEYTLQCLLGVLSVNVIWTEALNG